MRLAANQTGPRQIARPRSTTKGQMTIEFAVMFPVMLVIALIAFNALMFLSNCAAFDRIFREAVCVYAPSPASGEDTGQTCAHINEQLETFADKTYLACNISPSARNDGLTTYTGTLFYTPTLFGAYPLREVFGVSLPAVEHNACITVDSYKPGVFL